jgi:hypothetical protein
MAFANDVFDELFQSRAQRFSMSMPNDEDENECDDKEMAFLNYLQSLSRPPSPNSDAIDSMYYYDTDNESSPIKDIQTLLPFPKNELIITEKYDTKLYKIPPKTSLDAHTIWKAANIPQMANLYTIEWRLLDWAYTYADIFINNKKVIRVQWKSANKSLCEASWSAFLKWIMCACNSV